MQREIKFSQRSFHGPLRQMPRENFNWAKTAFFQNLSNTRITFSDHPYINTMQTAQEAALNQTHLICKKKIIYAIQKACVAYFYDKWLVWNISFHA
jgi:hypothetical protein